MKKLLSIVLILLLLPIIGKTQMPSDAIFQKYAKKEGIEASVISGFMLKPFADKLTSSLKGVTNEEAATYLKNIKSIGILQTTDKKPEVVKELLAEANKLIQNGKYTELIAQKRGNMSFKIVGLKSNGTITEVLGFGSADNEAMLVTVQGTFTEAMINELLVKVKTVSNN